MAVKKKKKSTLLFFGNLFSGLQFMPVDCTSTSITQLILKDWPQIRREGPKLVVRFNDLLLLCLFLMLEPSLFIFPLVFPGNVYIHPTANIDPTAMVSVFPYCIALNTINAYNK